MTLYIDIENKKLVQSITSDRSVSTPVFMQGDNEPLEIFLLQKGGELSISGVRGTKNFHFNDVEWLYRVSYNPDNPHELLISGQKKGGYIFSWIFNPSKKIPI